MRFDFLEREARKAALGEVRPQEEQQEDGWCREIAETNGLAQCDDGVGQARRDRVMADLERAQELAEQDPCHGYQRGYSCDREAVAVVQVATRFEDSIQPAATCPCGVLSTAGVYAAARTIPSPDIGSALPPPAAFARKLAPIVRASDYDLGSGPTVAREGGL